MFIGKIVSKTKCLDAIRSIEEGKIKSMQDFKKLVQAGRISQQASSAFLQIEEKRVSDRIFLLTGIENEDISKTVRDLNLPMDEDFKNLKVELMQKMAKAQADWAKI